MLVVLPLTLRLTAEFHWVKSACSDSGSFAHLNFEIPFALNAIQGKCSRGSVKSKRTPGITGAWRLLASCKYFCKQQIPLQMILHPHHVRRSFFLANVYTAVKKKNQEKQLLGLKKKSQPKQILFSCFDFPFSQILINSVPRSFDSQGRSLRELWGHSEVWLWHRVWEWR